MSFDLSLKSVDQQQKQLAVRHESIVIFYKVKGPCISQEKWIWIVRGIITEPNSLLYLIKDTLKGFNDLKNKQQKCMKQFFYIFYFFKNFMDPFCGWGSTALRLEPLWGGSLLFTNKFQEIPGTHYVKVFIFWKFIQYASIHQSIYIEIKHKC